MKRDNRGLSLVEMIIVVAILAVVGGLMTMGISAVVSKPADECASKLEASLKNARITTMGKQSVTLKLYEKDDCIYLKEEVITAGGTSSTKDIKIGAKDVEVSYKLVGGSTYSSLGDSSNPLVLAYKRSTGGFMEITPGSNQYCEEIKITKGTRERFLKMAHLTGKVTLE